MSHKSIAYQHSSTVLLETLAALRADSKRKIGRVKFQLKFLEQEDKIEMLVTGTVLPLQILFFNDTENQRLNIKYETTVPGWLLLVPIVMVVAPWIRGGSATSMLYSIVALLGCAGVIFALSELASRRILRRVIKLLSDEIV